MDERSDAPTDRTTTPRRGALPWLWLSAVVLALDLATKQLALSWLVPGRPVTVIDGLLDWRLAFNPGAAFSLLADAGGWQRWVFSAFAVGISGLLVYWLARTPREDWRTALPFALIIGGALGNLHDRIRLGEVVDFIDFHIAGYHWPAFNVADSAIVAGAIGVVLFGLRDRNAG